MTVCEDDSHVRQATTADPRITRVGYYLRVLSIDELPQLINIIEGDMAFIGPRPHAVAHDRYYAPLVSDYSLRHIVKPGLTGWAQVNGCRGETQSVEKMADRLKLDLWYIGNRRPALKTAVLILTLVSLSMPIVNSVRHIIAHIRSLRAR